MAKRRKEKDEDEDKPFKMPKFDEEAFLKRERRNIKATVLAFLLGAAIAAICFMFWALMGKNDLRWWLVVLVFISCASFLKALYLKLNIDLTDFQKKNWFSSYAIYFFTWMIVFIVLVNPPFYDDEAPLAQVVTLPEIQELGGKVGIIAKITDNVGVNKDSIKVDITDPNDNTTTLDPTSFDYNDLIVLFNYDNPEGLLGEFTYTLTAKDVNGESVEKIGSFSYDTELIKVTSSTLTNITKGDDITIEVEEGVSKENFRVYYTLDEGDEINVNRKYLEVMEEYETSPKYEGWAENSNYTMKLFVEVSHYFLNIPIKYSNVIEGSTTYEVTTGSDDDIGEEAAPMPWNWSQSASEQKDVNHLNYDNVDANDDGTIDGDEASNTNILPAPRVVKAPGFEAIVFLVSLIAVVLIFKYKKKNRSNKK